MPFTGNVSSLVLAFLACIQQGLFNKFTGSHVLQFTELYSTCNDEHGMPIKTRFWSSQMLQGCARKQAEKKSERREVRLHRSLTLLSFASFSRLFIVRDAPLTSERNLPKAVPGRTAVLWDDAATTERASVKLSLTQTYKFAHRRSFVSWQKPSLASKPYVRVFVCVSAD